MKQYRFPENTVTKIAIGVVLFLLLLVTRDTMFSMVTLGFYRCQFLMLGLIGLLGIWFLVYNRKDLLPILKDRRMTAIAVVSVVYLLPMLVKGDWQLMYFSILLGAYFAIFLTYFLSAKEVARCFVIALSVLAVYSLIGLYLLRPMVDAGILSARVCVNSRGRDFYDFGLTFVSIHEVSNRNFGIFREPGVYQFFLMLGLFLNNYTVEWKKHWQLWLVNGILAATMISTFATGGVLEMGLFAVVLFFDKKWYKDKRALAGAIVLVAAVIGVVLYSIEEQNALYYALREMTMKLVENPESTGSRITSILTNVSLFFQNPIFGTELAAVLEGVQDNTSSTTILYAIFGILGGTLHVLSWVALVWEKKRKLWANLALLLILFMAFNTQNLTWNIYFWLFPCMALAERGLPLLKKRG